MFNKIVCLLLILTSCYREPQKVIPDDKLNRLITKRDLYINLTKDKLGPNNEVFSDKCDSLLFTGLYSAALPGTTDISLFFNQDEDRWQRNTDHNKCLPEKGDTHSTISRDMILGLMINIWYNKDSELAQKLYDHVKKYNLGMNGEGTIGELKFTPVLLNTLARMTEALGGTVVQEHLAIPAVFFEEDDYPRHLGVWHILLRGEVRGKISEHEYQFLKTAAETNPNNPLYQAAYHKFSDGDQSKAVNLLLNLKQFPNNRLPNSEDRCSEWIIQREDNNKDWQPCTDSVEEYTGAELIVIVNLVILSQRGNIEHTNK